MNTDGGKNGLDALTEKVIGCAYAVSNGLGAGFLEKVYENALAYELRKCGIRVDQQRPVAVKYDGIIVGEYFADLLVEEVVIIELKAVRTIDAVHIAQCLNYLRASSMPLGLILNFGTPQLQIKRLAN